MLTWNPDPVLLYLGPVQVRWYGFLFLVAFIMGFWGGLRICSAEVISPKKNLKVFQFTIVGVLLGARLVHCFFYEPAFFLSHPWEIFMTWHGGMASHGGILGGLLALWFFCLRNPEYRYFWLLDRLSLLYSFGAGFIRLGNFMNSEILGKPVSWGIIFARVDNIPRHPAQIYEAVFYFLLFGFLLKLYRSYQYRPPYGLLLGLGLAFSFLGRFLIEFLKENQEAFQMNLPLNMGQLLSIPMVILGGAISMMALRRNVRDAPNLPL